MERLSFYIIETEYCDFLRKTDPCVPYTMDQKARRPFVGIILTEHGTSYYAPLSFPKPKHLRMKNNVDLLKIDDGKYGVINLNNMIPVHPHSVRAVNPTISALDNAADIQYKKLLANQLTWCNANREKILGKAKKLYQIISNGHHKNALAERCCKFAEDEQMLKVYCDAKGWDFPWSL